MIETITTAGVSALARALSETFEIRFTKCLIGDGAFDPESQDAEEMTALIDAVAELDLKAVRKEAFGCSVVADLNNTISGGGAGSLVPAGTPIAEIGVYASIGDEDEFLFAYGYDPNPDTIPEGEGTYERRFVSRFAMSQDELELAIAFESFTDSFEEAIAPIRRELEESIEGKADMDHEHDASDITSGVLPITRGGTGAASSAAALVNLGGASAERVAALESAAAFDHMLDNNAYTGRNIAEIPEIAAEVAEYSAPWLFLAARIAAGNYAGLRIGDYFNVPLTGGSGKPNQSSVRYDIAAFDHYYNCSDQPIGHHIVCVPHSPIDMTGSSYAINTSYIYWNTTATNQGSSTQANPYIISNLHKWELQQYLGMLPSTLQNKLLNHRSLCESRYSASGNLNASTGWAWADLGKVWSPSEMEVYGCCVWGTPSWTIGMDSQFPIFRETRDRIRGGRVTWWLRSVSGSSASDVCHVNSTGAASYASATYTWVRPLPCFLLGA